MTEIWVSFGAAMGMLRTAVGLPGDSESALEARVRQLATAGVPKLKRSAANARFRYGLTEVTELAVALSLINGRMAPATAARYTLEEWRVFAPAAVAGARTSFPPGYGEQRPDRAGPFIIIPGNALSTLGRRAVREKTPEPLAAVAAYPTAAAAAAVLEKMSTASWINTSSFMPPLVDLFAAHSIVPEEVWSSLDRLRQSEQRSGDWEAGS